MRRGTGQGYPGALIETMNAVVRQDGRGSTSYAPTQLSIDNALCLKKRTMSGATTDLIVEKSAIAHSR